MTESPLLSYIVLSYNYERYIRQTLDSIVAQSVQDFEIVVVDDASADRSVEVITSFDDARVRLLQNDTNIGGAASYNRAVEAARGQWLVNLDADDWIAPTKAERQLAAVRKDPRLDIVGTYVSIRDETGAPQHRTVEQSYINARHDLNLTDTWIGANHLCRSSTMVRTAAHRRIGLDDADMVRAPDYELWTRGLQAGLRMEVLPHELTFMRMHSRQVTHGDPLATFLEMSFAALRNLVPRCERLGLYSSYAAILAWVSANPSLSGLLPLHAFRLMGMFLEATPVSNFRVFRTLLEDEHDRPYLAELGKRGLALVNRDQPTMTSTGTTSSSSKHVITGTRGATCGRSCTSRRPRDCARSSDSSSEACPDVAGDRTVHDRLPCTRPPAVPSQGSAVDRDLPRDDHQTCRRDRRVRGKSRWDVRSRRDGGLPRPDRLIDVTGTAKAFELIGATIEDRRIDLVLQVGAASLYAKLPRWKESSPHIRIADILYNEFGHTLNHFLYEQCFDAVVVESEAMRGYVERASSKQHPMIEVVRSGVDLGWFRPPDRPPSDDAPMTLGYIGRMSPKKNPIGFVDLAERLLALDPELMFRMAGGGPSGYEVEQRLARSLFRGRIVHEGFEEDPRSALHKIDCLILPSKYDGMPAIVMEATPAAFPSWPHLSEAFPN